MSPSQLMTKAQQGTTYELCVGEVDIQWTLDAIGRCEGRADADRGTDPPNLSGTFLVLALKVLCPGNP